MILRQRLAIGCILTGMSCLPNGYQFVRQDVMPNFGWGLLIAGTVMTFLGGYLFYVQPGSSPEAKGSAKRQQPEFRKKAKK